jgi:hypothetical protein
MHFSRVPIYSTGDESGKGQCRGAALVPQDDPAGADEESAGERSPRVAPGAPNVFCGEMQAEDRIYMLIYSLIEKTREEQFPPKPKELDNTCLIG